MNNQAIGDVSQEEFTRVALLTGRPLYWCTNNSDAINHAKAVHKLVQYFLELPEGSLGVASSVKG